MQYPQRQKSQHHNPGKFTIRLPRGALTPPRFQLLRNNMMNGPIWNPKRNPKPPLRFPKLQAPSLDLYSARRGLPCMIPGLFAILDRPNGPPRTISISICHIGYADLWTKRLDTDSGHNVPDPLFPTRFQTPEFDSYMSIFMAKRGRDPRKDIEKGLKLAQDKLLDITGSLTQALVLTDEAITQGSPLDPMLIWNWLQCCICIVSNANSALLAERRRAVLLQMDPQIAYITI